MFIRSKTNSDTRERFYHMNTKRSKSKLAWLDSEEGRITTMMQHGFLSRAVGEKLLLELQQAAKLKAQKPK